MIPVDRSHVVIVGGGPAGCATAVALANLGMTGVVLISPGLPSSFQVGETLSPDTRGILQQLGLWDGFVADQHEPCLGSCSAWGSSVLGYNDFLLSPRGTGWHIDRNRFEDFLFKRACASSVTFRIGRVTDVARDVRFRLTLRDPKRTLQYLEAEFVVDASGTSSTVAKRLGARRQVVDKLTFICGHFRHDGTERRSTLTLLEAAKDGWWYTADLPNGRVIATLATEAEFARSLTLHEPHQWMMLLKQTKHVARRLHNCTLDPFRLTAKVVAPFRLDRVSDERWLAVGDAAAAYDPISSQGIEKALDSARHAAEAVARAIASGTALSPDYGRRIIQTFDEYRANRDYFYAIERRWAEAPFWRNRRARSISPVTASLGIP